MDIRKILITDYHSASNRGDAAILEGEIATFKDRFPNTDITIKTQYPDAAELIHGIKAVSQHLVPFQPFNLVKNGAMAFSFLNIILENSTGIRLPFRDVVIDKLGLQPYYDADIVISTGGQFITGDYYPGKLGVHIEWYLAKLLGKPLIVYAQSLGPFSRPYRTLIKHALNQADIIITRDELSKEHLNKLGVTTPIHIGVDAAWTMPLNVDSRPLEQLMEPNPNLPESDGPLISISTRRWSHFKTENGEDQYFQSVADTAMELIDTKDAEIVFLSTCTGLAGYHTDDRVAALHVIDRMDYCYHNRVKIISEELIPQQLTSLYGQVDLHIGTRMHSCILSILAGTPIVAIEYQFKTSEMMSQFGLEDYVVSIENLDHKTLSKVVKAAIKDKENIKQQMDTHFPEVQETARRNGKIVQQYLKPK